VKKKYLLIGLAGLILLTACGKKEVKEEEEVGKVVEELNDNEDVAVNDEMENMALDWFENMDTVDLDGNKINQSMFQEYDLTIVNVWNSECPPCIAEIPELQKLAEKYTNVGVKGMPIEVAGFNIGIGLSDEEEKVVGDIMKNASANYQQILTWEGLLDTDFFQYIEVFPTTFFLDSEGQIIDIYAGARNLDNWSILVEENLKELENEQ